MSRVRFATAQEVFEAYATVAADVGQPPTDEAPLAYLDRMIAQPVPNAGVAFLAYMLPKREAVWFGCRAVRALSGEALAEGEDGVLLLAEGWVREPSEDRRRLALRTFYESAETHPAHWILLAAGRSSGFQSLDDSQPVPVEPFMTARNVMIGVLMAGVRIPPELYRQRLAEVLTAGAAFAGGATLAL